MSNLNLRTREQVLAAEIDFDSYKLPQLPDAEAAEIYERLQDAERRLVSPNLRMEDYNDGTASYPDEIYTLFGDIGRVLLSSEHATDQRRQYRTRSGRRRKEADYGTAALGEIVSEDTQSSHMTMLGRQLGDANDDTEHPFKRAISGTVDALRPPLYASLHGITRGWVSSLADSRGYNVLLGVGSNPSPETINATDKIKDIASTYDLRLGVNQNVLRFESGNIAPRLGEDGSTDTVNFSAKGKGTTRYFIEQYASENNIPLAAIQFEISAIHRLMPDGQEVIPDKRRRIMGVYLGYLFLKDCAEQLAVST